MRYVFAAYYYNKLNKDVCMDLTLVGVFATLFTFMVRYAVIKRREAVQLESRIKQLEVKLEALEERTEMLEDDVNELMRIHNELTDIKSDLKRVLNVVSK